MEKINYMNFYRVCPVCRKDFKVEGKTHMQFYCKDECRGEANRLKLYYSNKYIKKDPLWYHDIILTGCKFCGATEELSLDHKIPICRGGSFEKENLQCLCKSCNSKKGSKTNQEYYDYLTGNWWEYDKIEEENALAIEYLYWDSRDGQ